MKRPILLLVIGAWTIALGLAASPGDDRTPDDVVIEKISSLRGVVLDRREPPRQSTGNAAEVPAMPTREPANPMPTETASPSPPPPTGQAPTPTGSPAATTTPSPPKRSSANGLAVQEVELVAPLTGQDSPARTLERWNIKGSDLGISFQHEGKTYIVFGDTFGQQGIEGPDWRSNTMGVLHEDPRHRYVLGDLVKDENGEAKELLSSLKEKGIEYTVMPTSAIAVGDRIYIHYMSIRDWEEKWWGYKYPVVNGAGFAYSDDGGVTWTKDETARWEGDSNFTQTSLVKLDGFIYVFGTPAGRFVPARLMRVPEDELLNPSQYSYWTGEDWSSDPAQAAIVVDWPVGELSVRWSDYHERWLMMYKNELDHTIVIRTAPRITGPWDDERVVVTDDEFPSLYAPLMLPTVDGPDVYFTMSNFFPYYNVSLMRLRLD